jgi:hypothetical protein
LSTVPEADAGKAVVEWIHPLHTCAHTHTHTHTHIHTHMHTHMHTHTHTCTHTHTHAHIHTHAHTYTHTCAHTHTHTHTHTFMSHLQQFGPQGPGQDSSEGEGELSCYRQPHGVLSVSLLHMPLPQDGVCRHCHISSEDASPSPGPLTGHSVGGNPLSHVMFVVP